MVNLNAEIIKLPEEIINQIRELSSHDKRNALELLLVASGAKPGDVIDWIKKDSTRNEMISIIDQLDNVDYFTVKNNKFPQTYYYNKEMVSDELLELMNNIGEMNQQMTSLVEGLFYGYPLCCIINYNEKTKPLPLTEHHPCSNECKASHKLQELYLKAIRLNDLMF